MKSPSFLTTTTTKGEQATVTVLVRDGRHMRPMLAVLKRNGIGEKDTYNRGLWISKRDLPSILEAIKAGPWAVQCSVNSWDWACAGTNQHNSARVEDFLKLFGIEDFQS